MRSIRKLAEDEFELTEMPSGPDSLEVYDLHIRREGEKWVVTVFDSSVKNADDAFIDARQYDSLEEALNEELPL